MVDSRISVDDSDIGTGGDVADVRGGALDRGWPASGVRIVIWCYPLRLWYHVKEKANSCYKRLKVCGHICNITSVQE